MVNDPRKLAERNLHMNQLYNSYLKLGITEEFSAREWKDYKKIDELSSIEKKKYDKLYDIVDRWILAINNKKTDLNLFLFGANGCGKSTLGCLILKRFKDESNQPVMRMSMMKIQNDFYSTWKIPTPPLARAVIFLEEIGKEYRTNKEHSESVLEYILKYRTENNLATIVSSNCDIKALSDRYGETLNSVLKGRFYPLNFPSIDLRQRCVDKKIENLLKGDINDENKSKRCGNK